MTDCNKREVKAKSDLDNVLDSVKQEEKEKKNTMKNIENTEKLISSKSEVWLSLVLDFDFLFITSDELRL